MIKMQCVCVPVPQGEGNYSVSQNIPTQKNALQWIEYLNKINLNKQTLKIIIFSSGKIIWKRWGYAVWGNNFSDLRRREQVTAQTAPRLSSSRPCPLFFMFWVSAPVLLGGGGLFACARGWCLSNPPESQWLDESLNVSPLCLLSTTFLTLTFNQIQDLFVPFGTFSDCEHILWYVHLQSCLNKLSLMGSVAEFTWDPAQATSPDPSYHVVGCLVTHMPESVEFCSE